MSGIPAGAGSLLGKQLGKYEILALLALGGTAEIYLARIGGHAGFEKYVVVKCLHDHLADDPVFVKMFLDEARLAAHLDHSNIVQTMELGEHEQRYFMVMEFLAGLSLAMAIRRASERLPGGKIPVSLTLNIIAQACAGLHYAHERAINGKPLNIVHRDISPQNLVVSFEGVVKVVDFGIAKAELRETKTQSGTIKGKFAYMSPEQCIAANVDRRTDVFALGVIAHEMLTGRRLFKRNSPYETYQSVIECNVDPPSKMNHELDPSLDGVIMKALAKDKDDRYPTAEAFGDALQSYLHHRGKSSGPGDISRFFDGSFGQEIEEHGTRMRELIQGREKFAGDTGWGEDEDDKRAQTIDIARGKQNIGDEKSQTLDTQDLVEVERPSAGSLSNVIDDLGGDRGGDEGDLPPDRTRIETNPLERMAELDAAAKDQDAKITSKGQPTVALQPERPARPAQQPHQAHKMPPSGPLPLPDPPSGPAAAPPKERFLSSLPTMIAEPDPEPASPGLDDDMGATVVVADSAQEPAAAAPPPLSQPAVAPPVVRPPPQIQLGPTGYPMMTPQMSEAVARGGDVFPSVPPGGRLSGPLGGHVGDSGPHAPQSGANLMSPVGGQYPQQVDWAEAAAMPTRAVPPWMLGVLFVAAIGLALTITIIIAKIAS